MFAIDAISSPENLFWAWEKVKQLYAMESVWFDDLELAHFEGTLREQFNSLHEDLKSGQYRCRALRPLPHPKGNDRTSLELRQSFAISVRDQVAWLAVINIVGPPLDEKMVSWSYGNRLNRAIWPEVESLEQTTLWRFGPYRHTNRRLYRRFHQSWPLFRRYIFLTLKKMSKATARAMPSDSYEDSLIHAEEFAPQHKRIPYLIPGYWKDDSSDVYWCSLDFKKFYPNINLDIIARNLLKFCPPELATEDLGTLVRNLLTFRVDTTGWSGTQLRQIGLRARPRSFTGLPTGLMVSGYFGGSLATSVRYKPQFRTVYRHEGAELYTSQIVDIPVRSMWLAQNNDLRDPSTGEQLYKGLPPNYHAPRLLQIAS
jgi:hypothetical protein